MSEFIADKSFDLNNTKEYILSIQVSLDGFNFSVTHNSRLLALGQYPVKISSDKFLARRFSEWLSDENIFSKSWAGTRIIYFTGKITIVPGEYYDYEKQDEIINLIFGKQSGYLIRDNYWIRNRCNLIFPIHEQFLKEAGQKFTEYQIIHPATVLNKKTEPYLNDNRESMALYFNKHSFCHILYIKKELRSVNCYAYTNADDVMFYLLSVLNANDISNKNCDLLAGGNIDASGELFKRLSNFAGSFSFIDTEVTFDQKVFAHPLHPFITIV